MENEIMDVMTKETEQVVEETVKPAIENVTNVVARLDNKQVAVVAGGSILATLGGCFVVKLVKDKVVSPIIRKIKERKAAKASEQTTPEETTENPEA